MQKSPSSSRGSFIAKLGAWLQAVPLLVIVAWMFGMENVIAPSYGYSSYSGVRYDIFTMSWRNLHTGTIVAASTALVGLMLMTIAITACRYRAMWLLKFIRFYGVLTLSLSLMLISRLPSQLHLYLPFAVFFLFFAQVKKKEFLQAHRLKRKAGC